MHAAVSLISDFNQPLTEDLPLDVDVPFLGIWNRLATYRAIGSRPQSSARTGSCSEGRGNAVREGIRKRVERRESPVYRRQHGGLTRKSSLGPAYSISRRRQVIHSISAAKDCALRGLKGQPEARTELPAPVRTIPPAQSIGAGESTSTDEAHVVDCVLQVRVEVCQL